MKRAGITICLVAMILITMFMPLAVSAEAEGELTIVESYPSDGSKNASIENLGVKLTFNNPVTAEANQKANSACFSLVDSEGNEMPIKVYFNPDDNRQVLVLYDTGESDEAGVSLKGSEDYALKISGDFVDDSGNTLTGGKTISFTTVNQKLNSRIYLVMMVVLMVGMVVYSARQAKKQQESDGADTKDDAFNPYKEAKRTGKSVKEVIAEHEKEVAKRQAKEAKKASSSKPKTLAEKPEPEVQETGNYKVKAPKRISDYGGKYITGRKAIAEAKKAEEERLAKRRAANKKKKKK